MITSSFTSSCHSVSLLIQNLRVKRHLLTRIISTRVHHILNRHSIYGDHCLTCYCLINRCLVSGNVVHKVPRVFISSGQPVCTRNQFSTVENRNRFHTSTTWLKRRKTKEEKKFKNIIQFKPKSKKPVLPLWPGITVSQLAEKTERTLAMVFEAMTYVENCGHYRSPKSEIHDTVALLEVSKKLGYSVQLVKKPSSTNVETDEDKNLYKLPPPNPHDLVKKPPVVTIMGHVDHGKTTLLDSLRHTNVTAQEHGGITQHIGAFTVQVPNGLITFLDTPGHAAFHAMRARGAHATDLVVLVVAADDSIMEQTLESIRFAREAEVPIIVAINKIDKPHADVERVKSDLLACGIQIEELGGDVQAVCISALQKLNLDLLTEAILTQAEVLDIKGCAKGPVEGIILETQISLSKGKLATILVQRGTLKKGCFLVAGSAWAKVKGIFDEHDKNMAEVVPGTPAQVTGWKKLPEAGDTVLEAEAEKHAQAVVHYREKLLQKDKAETDKVIIQKKLEEHLEKYRTERHLRLLKGRHRKESQYFREKEISVDAHPCLALVLKCDVHGSLEAIVDVINTYHSHAACRLDIIHAGVGNVTENDIVLAEAFEGVLYCFCTEIAIHLKVLAEEKNIEIKHFNVIYHLIDDLKLELSKRLPFVEEEDIVGEAAVLQQFLINEGKRKVPVAGCKCTSGILKKGSQCKVLRAKNVIYKGSIYSLKHEKTDVETIKTGVECGLRIEDPDISFVVGDTIVCFIPKYNSQVTDWNPGF